MEERILIRKCIQCNKEFNISEGEERFYRDRNLELPKRCQECRDKNKRQVNTKKYQEDNIRGKSNNTKKTINSKIIISAIAAIILVIVGLIQGFGDIDILSNSNNHSSVTSYTFRNDEYLTEHFNKHGSEFSYATKEEYQQGANNVINSSKALHKKEAEDNDDIYYIEDTNEFVVLSTDGYIRTYFKPSGGIDYYNRQ